MSTEINITGVIQTANGPAEVTLETKPDHGKDLFFIEVSFPKMDRENAERMANKLGLVTLQERKARALTRFLMSKEPKNFDECLQTCVDFLKEEHDLRKQGTVWGSQNQSSN